MSTSDPYLYRAASAVPYFSADGETYLAQTPLRDIQKSQPAARAVEDRISHSGRHTATSS